MSALKNARHERFAQELAKGKTASEAYVLAGYKPSRPHASHLQHQSNIGQRVAEILATRERIDTKAVERAIERTAITKQRVLEELAKIGFANMKDYMGATPEGDPYLDFSALTRDQAAALSEVTVEDFVDGRGENARSVRRVKFKLHDKKGALVDIGKEIGMFINRNETGKPGDFASLSDEELDRRLIALMMERGISERQARALVREHAGPDQPLD
jgi:phage terminase small subunit